MVLVRASGWSRHAAGAVIVAAAFGLRIALDPLLGESVPFLTFFPAVCLAAWLGGWQPGLLAMVLSIAASWYWFLPERGELNVTAGTAVSIVLFASFCVVIIYIVQALHDAVADRDASRRHAENSQATLRGLVEVAPVGIALFDEQRRFTLVNKTLAAMNGIPIEAHLGRTVAEVLPAIAPAVADKFTQVLETGRPLPAFELAVETPAAPGETRIFVESWFPVGQPGAIAGVGAIVLEATAERKAVEALREVGRRKDEFLAALSHEMRSPLTAIANSVHVLRRGIDPRAVEIISRQAGHLQRLVGDLFDLARTQEGKLPLIPVPMVLQEVLRNAAEMAEGAAQKKQQLLALALPPQPIRLVADAGRLTQVFGNLLDNAVKFSPEGATIAVEAEQDGDFAVVRVRDQGGGIAADMLPRIFDMYWQGVAGSASRRAPGLGIGLALAQNFVRLHRGSIVARSEGLGRGSEFTVRLPCGFFET